MPLQIMHRSSLCCEVAKGMARYLLVLVRIWALITKRRRDPADSAKDARLGMRSWSPPQRPIPLFVQEDIDKWNRSGNWYREFRSCKWFIREDLEMTLFQKDLFVRWSYILGSWESFLDIWIHISQEVPIGSTSSKMMEPEKEGDW